MNERERERVKLICDLKKKRCNYYPKYNLNPYMCVIIIFFKCTVHICMGYIPVYIKSQNSEKIQLDFN